MSEPTSPLRGLPSVSKLLACPEAQRLVAEHGRRAVVAELRGELERCREQLGRTTASPGSESPALPQGDAIIAAASEQLRRRAEATRLRPVINATGILLHTGLGRAPLAPQAVEAITSIAGGYANVELDLETGRRGQRGRVLEHLLCELTGGEAALVVNNNAAATLLTLTAMAAGREVIVSRGELVEIGGQFRLPDIMATSGAVLREVGTTNKTRISDYGGAIGERTAALMLVHPSNYAVIGFTQQVALAELVALGRQHDTPVIHDIGSGALIDFAPLGFRDEPLASRSISQGADVVLFSGDKLLGGPQCGVIIGRRRWIEELKNHPLARALRVDKLTLAALAATLELYRDPQRAKETVPLLRLLQTPLAQLHQRAERIAADLQSAPTIHRVEVIDEQSYLGGGSIPGQQQPTVCVAITPQAATLEAFAGALRTSQPGIVGRIRNQRYLLDLRTVFPEQDHRLTASIRQLTF